MGFRRPSRLLSACVWQTERGTFWIVTEDHPPAGSNLPPRQSKRLRVSGVIVLVLGLLGAGALYWIRTHSGEPTEDELLAGNARLESHQMGLLYGRMGLLTQELSDDLKQPGTQAFLIAAVSVLIAAGCFYFARLEDDNNEVG
jgi:hypothetical protein